MRKKTIMLFVAIMSFFLLCHQIALAAHFRETGTSSIHIPLTFTFTQYQWCNFDWGIANTGTTIDPDGDEKIGDPVTINHCYSGNGSTSTPGSRYLTIAGIGDASSFNVACLPNPSYTPSSNPATLILNPGPSQTTMINYGPQVLTGNQNVTITNQCATTNAHIGDTINPDFGIFALLYDTQYRGPNPDSGGSASFTFTLDLGIQSAAQTTSVPTMTEWGMIVFALLAGLGSVYYLRRQKRTGN